MTRPEIESLLEGAYFPDAETRKAVIARVSEAIPQVTERKTAKPIECWAVVDKDGNTDIKSLSMYTERADHTLAQLNRLFPELAPFRVARVVISEVEPAP